MPKWAKLITAVLLLPVCWGASRSVWRLIRASGQADTIWVTLGAGVACWLVIYLLLPKPRRLYILGHELTHALWTWLFGGRVKRWRISGRGGHVLTNRSNFLVVLAPYFFPVYALGVGAVFTVGNLIWGWRTYSPVFHLLLGAAYAFHITLTWEILQTRQTDIASQGYLFSAVAVWLGNLAVLLLGLPWLTGKVGVLTALAWCWEESGRALAHATQLF